MAVFTNYDDDELIISCGCGCDDGIHFRIYHEFDDDYYAMAAFINGNFYKDQKWSFIEKLKKIVAIIFNKDFYYSDICMSKDDWQQFKEWINKS